MTTCTCLFTFMGFDAVWDEVAKNWENSRGSSTGLHLFCTWPLLLYWDSLWEGVDPKDGADMICGAKPWGQSHRADQPNNLNRWLHLKGSANRTNFVFWINNDTSQLFTTKYRGCDEPRWKINASCFPTTELHFHYFEAAHYSDFQRDGMSTFNPQHFITINLYRF